MPENLGKAVFIGLAFSRCVAHTARTFGDAIISADVKPMTPLHCGKNCPDVAGVPSGRSEW
jgi:hypothetical protein